ncbi:MAG: energy transducer TonB [Methyloglobulus sp.]|nr:energy transducer TonB [Methyloglobulus sp.]
MTLFFVEPQHPILSRLPFALAYRIRWRRAVAVALVTVLVCALHCLLMFQYSDRSIPEPEPTLETQPKPLPMIGIVLEAPTGAMAKVKPTETKPALTKAKISKKAMPNPDMDKPKAAVKKRVAKPQEQAAMPQSQAIASPSQRPDVVGSNVDSDSQLSEMGIKVPARASADYLQNPKPKYPGIARSRHWQGLVELHVYITPEGLCGELKLLHGSGHDELDEAAMDAVRVWKFVPAKLDNKPVASWVTIPIEFNLND